MGDGAAVELIGGPLDGLVIRYGPGGAPGHELVIERGGMRAVYAGTAERNGAGAIVHRYERGGD